MEVYNYKEAVEADVKNYLFENIGLLGKYFLDKKELAHVLQENLQDEDSVTGGYSLTYTHSAIKAERYLYGNWKLLKEAAEEFLCTAIILDKGPEIADVLIRRYLLDECIKNVLETISLTEIMLIAIDAKKRCRR